MKGKYKERTETKTQGKLASALKESASLRSQLADERKKVASLEEDKRLIQLANEQLHAQIEEGTSRDLNLANGRVEEQRDEIHRLNEEVLRLNASFADTIRRVLIRIGEEKKDATWRKVAADIMLLTARFDPRLSDLPDAQRRAIVMKQVGGL